MHYIIPNIFHSYIFHVLWNVLTRNAMQAALKFQIQENRNIGISVDCEQMELDSLECKIFLFQEKSQST